MVIFSKISDIRIFDIAIKTVRPRVEVLVMTVVSALTVSEEEAVGIENSCGTNLRYFLLILSVTSYDVYLYK